MEGATIRSEQWFPSLRAELTVKQSKLSCDRGSTEPQIGLNFKKGVNM